MRERTIWGLLIGLAAAGLLSWWWLSGKPPAPQPPLSLTESPAVVRNAKEGLIRFDCGNVLLGERVEREARIRNSQSEPITIRHVATFCGCTDVDWTHDPIPPGETGVVHVVIDTSGFRPGPFKKDTVVHFVDRAHDPIPIEINGTTLALLHFEPDNVTLSPLVGAVQIVPVDVRVTGNDPMTIVSAHAESGRFDVDVQEPGSPAFLHHLVLRAKGVEPRWWRDRLVVRVRDGEGAERIVQHRVDIHHRNRIAVTPASRVIFSARETRSGAGATKQISLTSACDDCTFHIVGTNWKLGSGAFTVRIHTREELRDYVLDVALVSGDKEGLIRDKLIVSTDMENCRTLSIDVVAVGRGKLAALPSSR